MESTSSQAARDGLVPTERLRLADLEAIRLLLRGSSVIDWGRLSFETDEQIYEFIRAQELLIDSPADRARIEAIKNEAIDYLRRNFALPVPKPVAHSDLVQLLRLASGRGHRQLCACAILKVMHIIHHLDARELAFMFPASDQQMFQLVEQKVYRVLGDMLARGFPVAEFIGGRKNRESLYTKLLSKQETIAAQVYDKLRFRIVTRHADDIFSVLNYMMRHIFPFNYIIPNQSTNTFFHFRSYCQQQPHLAQLFALLQVATHADDDLSPVDNRFTDPAYRVIQFVVDMPVRVPKEFLEKAPAAAHALGPVIFVQAEFQIVDRETEQANERGSASHDAYKERQRRAVTRRLKLGSEGRRPRSGSASD